MGPTDAFSPGSRRPCHVHQRSAQSLTPSSKLVRTSHPSTPRTFPPSPKALDTGRRMLPILRAGREEVIPDGQPEMSFDRTVNNNPAVPETQGRKPKVSPEQLREADRFLQDYGFDARVLTWQQLAFELGFDIHGDTLCAALGSMDYHKCIACTNGWVSEKLAKGRHDVRFSDEVHCRVGPQGKIRITRKPGERYCADCIQEQLNRDDERD
ncbi:hypothetical protein EJ02DRAFT_479250 [Clathrospora elynae]|uniref:Uncharacterized protein n=1 Tax=Clathrospora elynae TaxID=706981 RepID=A0A6A5SE04_9PLEO|nr:hypothetical protein EJ02DRAFT_479250 [Clathrospora elynae]